MEKSNAQHLMKRYTYFILLLLIISLSLASFYYRIEMGKFLVLNELETGTERVIQVPHGRFEINYIHSVHKTPVEELFYISEDSVLVLYEIRYSSLGIGMPYEAEGGVFSHQGGQFYLTGLHKEFPVISLRASAIPAQTIRVDGQIYSLLKLFTPDNALQISAKQRLMLVRKGS